MFPNLYIDTMIVNALIIWFSCIYKVTQIIYIFWDGSFRFVPKQNIIIITNSWFHPIIGY